MEYKITEPNEDIKDAVIEKTGHKITFTMREVERVREHNAKELKAVKAQVEVNQAKMSNIEHFHPFVKEAKPEELLAYYMYYEAKGIADEGTKKIEEFEKSDKELEEELVDIYKQIPEFAPKVMDLTDE